MSYIFMYQLVHCQVLYCLQDLVYLHIFIDNNKLNNNIAKFEYAFTTKATVCFWFYVILCINIHVHDFYLCFLTF